MKLQWSASVISDRNNIFDYIDTDSPRAAILVDDRIWNSIENLKGFSEIGRPGCIAETRELIIQRTPYIVAYQVQGDSLRILRILHGAQRWQKTLPDR